MKIGSSHCKKGHAMTPDNTREEAGAWRCKTCHRNNVRRYQGSSLTDNDPCLPHAAVVDRMKAARRAIPPVTHCRNGHAYDDENTLTDKNGVRHCRQCSRDRQRAARGLNVPLGAPPLTPEEVRHRWLYAHNKHSDNGKKGAIARRSKCLASVAPNTDLLWDEYMDRHGDRRSMRCKYGHPRIRENLHLTQGKSGKILATCRECDAIRVAKYRSRKRGQPDLFDLLMRPATNDPKEQERQRIAEALYQFHANQD